MERALEQEIGCADVLHLVAAVRGAINGLMAEVVEDAFASMSSTRRANVIAIEREGAQELIDVVHSYLK